MTLEQYFKLIVKPTEKEPTMFEYLKNKWIELMTTRYSFVEPVEEEQEYDYEEGWAFVMRDESFEDISMRETIIAGNNDGTWMETVDQLLDVIGAHYGYNIKEQVYYSVHMPLNIEGEAGFGRCLNDEVLQKLLLSYPEVYDFKGHIEQ